MGSFGSTLSSRLSKLAGLVGLKTTERQRFEKMEQKLATHKAGNVDRLEALKEKIHRLEAQVQEKKKAYDTSRGDSQRIIAGEIERLFREIDRFRGQESIIVGNLDRISTAQTKLEEYNSAVMSGLSDDELDDLALGLQESFDDLRVVDRAAVDLDKIKYQVPMSNPVDAQRRTAEIMGERKAEELLSPEMEKRLNQLDKQES